jgi:hypothetical protein
MLTHQNVFCHGHDAVGLVADMDEHGIDIAWLLSREIVGLGPGRHRLGRWNLEVGEDLAYGPRIADTWSAMTMRQAGANLATRLGSSSSHLTRDHRVPRWGRRRLPLYSIDWLPVACRC